MASAIGGMHYPAIRIDMGRHVGEVFVQHRSNVA